MCRTRRHHQSLCVHAEYVGCFQVRGFFHDPGSYYYDPNHNLLSGDMHIDPGLYAVGTMYAVSGRVAEGLPAMPLALRDFGPNEGMLILKVAAAPLMTVKLCSANRADDRVPFADIAIGGILRALDVCMYDDRRLCAQTCTSSMIAMDMVTNDDMYRVDMDLCSNEHVKDLTCFTRVQNNASCQHQTFTEPPLIAPKWDLSIDESYFQHSSKSMNFAS